MQKEGVKNLSNNKCEYCNQGNDLSEVYHIDIFIYNNIMAIEYEDEETSYGLNLEIKYCPMCGRKL